MRRTIFIVAACILTLEGCDQPSQIARQAMLASVGANGENQQFSFINNWMITMRREMIIPRYERARSACLSDKTLGCKLIGANVTSSDNSYYSYSRASLNVQLPHSQVEVFKKGILAPLNNESTNDIKLETSTTRADNVSGESVSAGQKVNQLTAYRDQLAALAKRSNLSIEDTIRLGAEISRVQGELDAAINAKTDADDRVARETVNVTLQQVSLGPIADVWNRASNIFVQNVANVLAFLIGVIPWLPIVGGVVALFFWVRKFLRARRQKHSTTGTI